MIYDATVADWSNGSCCLWTISHSLSASWSRESCRSNPRIWVLKTWILIQTHTFALWWVAYAWLFNPNWGAKYLIFSCWVSGTSTSCPRFHYSKLKVLIPCWSSATCPIFRITAFHHKRLCKPLPSLQGEASPPRRCVCLLPVQALWICLFLISGFEIFLIVTQIDSQRLK